MISMEAIADIDAMTENSISRRDLISVRTGKKGGPLQMVNGLSSDFTTEMLFTEIMKMGKDPATMSRDDMLRAVCEELYKK